MRQGVLKFSKEFVYPNGTKEWVGIEFPVDFDRENAFDVLDNMKATTVGWFNHSNPDVYGQLGVQVKSVFPEDTNAVSEMDVEFEKAKATVESIEDQEDAIQWMNNNGWTFNIDLKKIANSKPKKLTEQ